MGRLTFAGPLGWSVAAAALPAVALANVGVPSAARMVHGAGLIVVATAQPGAPAIVPLRALKGDTVGHRSLQLADPSAGRLLNFKLGDVPAIVGAAPTVVLGQLDAARGILSITWLNASFWPQGQAHDTFDSSTLESTVAFIERLLGYSTLAAKDPDAAIRMLLQDIGSGRSASALAYLELAVETDLGPQNAALVRAVCAVALGRASLDAPSLRQLASILPMLPAALAAPLALNASSAATTPETAKRLNDALRALLSARGSALPPGADTAAYRQAVQALAPKLRRADAKRLLAVFDAPLPVLRDTYADPLMAAVTGARPAEKLATLTAPQRKAIWQREIDALPD